MEAIKLLKRKMSLAVTEEDYGMAAKIRDHPYMMLYKELHSNRFVDRTHPCLPVSVRQNTAFSTSIIQHPSMKNSETCSEFFSPTY